MLAVEFDVPVHVAVCASAGIRIARQHVAPLGHAVV
jgi:hypothetical protein